MAKLNLSKKTKKHEDDAAKQEPQKEKIDPSLLIPLPIVDFDEQLGLAVMEDGTFCDFLEIITKDLRNLSDDQLLFDKMLWEKLFDTYSDDLKIISFSFPAETDSQQRYLSHLLDRTENPGYRHFLQMRMEELQGIPRLFLTQSFVLCFYSKGFADYKDKYINITGSIGKTGHPLIKTISPARKKAIIRKLCNKNMAGDES